MAPLQEQPRQERKFDLNKHLSKRQGDVMALLVQCKTYRAIGDALCVSENTIRSHVKSIYAKAGVTSRPELMHLLLNAADSPAEPK